MYKKNTKRNKRAGARGSGRSAARQDTSERAVAGGTRPMPLLAPERPCKPSPLGPGWSVGQGGEGRSWGCQRRRWAGLAAGRWRRAGRLCSARRSAPPGNRIDFDCKCAMLKSQLDRGTVRNRGIIVISGGYGQTMRCFAHRRSTNRASTVEIRIADVVRPCMPSPHRGRGRAGRRTALSTAAGLDGGCRRCAEELCSAGRTVRGGCRI